MVLRNVLRKTLLVCSELFANYTYYLILGIPGLSRYKSLMRLACCVIPWLSKCHCSHTLGVWHQSSVNSTVVTLKDRNNNTILILRGKYWFCPLVQYYVILVMATLFCDVTTCFYTLNSKSTVLYYTRVISYTDFIEMVMITGFICCEELNIRILLVSLVVFIWWQELRYFWLG